MKKFLAIMLCSVMACFVLAGCSGKFVGTWKSVAMEEGGQKYTADDPDYGEIVKSMITIEVEKGGDATFNFGGSKESVEWKADGDTITFTNDGEDLDATLEDDQLVIEMEGTKVYLEKDD